MDKQTERSRQKDIAANIRRLRVLLGLTQAGLADKLDVSQQQVQKWERGTVSFSTSRLETLAAALGTELDELLKPSQTARGATSSSKRARPLSAMETELLEAFAAVGELSKKRLVLQLAKALQG